MTNPPESPDNTPIPAPCPSPGGGRKLAILSLVLALLSFGCINLLGSVPAVILSVFVLIRVRQGRMSRRACGMARTAFVLGCINIAVFTPLVWKYELFRIQGLSPPRDHHSCQSNLRQLGGICARFAMDNKDHLYPHLSPVQGELMPAKDEMFPGYVSDPRLFACPSTRHEERFRKPESLPDDTDYLYLGYTVANDVEIAAFCAAYKEHASKGLPFDTDLQVPAGQGNGGGNIIHRLQEGAERFTMTGINGPGASAYWQSQIPILIERPENHVPSGGNVLFMDGHVEFLRYPGQWPMTAQTVNALKELDAMGK